MTAHTPADDAGEVAALRDQVEKLRKDRDSWVATSAHATDTCKRLKTQRDEARAEVDNLRATLGKVAALADAWCPDGCDDDLCEGQRVRAALAADPVSLADVRAMCDCDLGDHCTECRESGQCHGSTARLEERIFAFLHDYGDGGIWEDFDDKNSRTVARALAAHLSPEAVSDRD